MKLTNWSARTALVGGAVTAVAIAGLSPAALAGPDQTDRPKVTLSGWDYGENWTLGAPRNGGHLEWELDNGITSVENTGYLYLTNHNCARIVITYYDNDDHDTVLGTDESASHCAPTNAKAQWFVSESFSSQFVEHVHVAIVTPAGTVLDYDNETFD